MKSKAKTKHLDDDSEDDSGSHDNSIDHALATPSDSLRRSSRRRAAPKTWVTRPKKETAGYWTTAEKEKLLLHLDELNTRLLFCKSHYLRRYRYPFPYIKKRIKSKSIAQIKCFMSMLEHRKASAVMTRMKQQSPLESWRELADKLTMLGNDDCCRQLIRVCSVMALESTEDKDDTTNTTSATLAGTAAAATRKRYRRPTKTAAAMTTTTSAAPVRAAQVLAATGRESAAAVTATAPEALAATGKAASTITAASTTTASAAEPAAEATTSSAVSTTTAATAAEPPIAATSTTERATTTTATAAALITATTAAEPPIAATSTTERATTTTAAPITAATAVTPTRTCQPFVDTMINKPTLVPMPDGRFMAIPNTPASSIVNRPQTTISEADMPLLKPDYASIYKYIGGIMQGNKKELGPLESMIVLDCLKMVEDHLKIKNNKNEKEFMQGRFFDIFQKFYLSIDQEDALNVKKETDYLDPVTVSTLLPNQSPIGGQVETENSPEEVGEMDTAQNGLADAEMMDQSEEASGLENQSEDNLQGENENEGLQNRNSEKRISVEAHRERRLKLELGSLNPFNIPVQRLEIRKDK